MSQRPVVDAERFHHYTCTACLTLKLAALFAPAQIKERKPVCMLCTGELALGSILETPRPARKFTRPAWAWGEMQEGAA